MRKAKESWEVSFEPGAERDRVGIDVAGKKMVYSSSRAV